MDLYAVSDQVRALLQQRGRLAYRMLTLQFQLDEKQLEAITEELIDIQEVAADKDGKMLVWTGDETAEETTSQTADAPATASPSPPPSPQPEQETPTGERRQLTVMFCDLVGSTALSEQLDPEELQTVVRTYQEVSAQVIERYDGYIAQYLGDGLLVYFGYPAAHEDDAARGIRAGLEIISALEQARSQFPQPVQVRVGIHTGPVVLGQMGSGKRYEQLALGETPNIAARVQGQAAPDEVVISAATQRLVTGLFETQDRGLTELRGISTPQSLFRVAGESEAHSRFEVAMLTGLAPLVGREEELGLLRRRWERVQAGEGQIILLSGEPGIGKSRLLQELKALTAAAAPAAVECRCSAYLQNSALAPVIGHVERLLRFDRTDSSETKLHKLEQMLTAYEFALPDTVPLLAALLSVPLPDTYAPLQSSPRKQKEQTLELLVTWLRKDAERRPVRIEFEDLHWADPSTVEFLTVLVEQIPTMRALLILTFRPDFSPPWPSRASILPLHLDRLPQSQIAVMAEHVAGKALPTEVVEQVVAKTDGVPLFVEELTKMVVESGQLQETGERFQLASPLQQMSIPTTLQDSLQARLDHLNAAQEVAQVGATIGREFSYGLIQAVSGLEDATLRQGLRQLVDADLIFQKGLPPQAQYAFKHALVQDTAYQSLLKSRRQHLHAQTAQVLEQQFPETVTAQPELLAHHYTEASLMQQAIPFWHQAGRFAAQRFANQEAMTHLSTALELLMALPDTSERAEQELATQLALGAVLIATKGYGAAEVGQVYTRASELTQQVGETPLLFPALWGLGLYYQTRAEYQLASEQGHKLLSIAQNVQDPALLVEAHYTLTHSTWMSGAFRAAYEHGQQALHFYDPQKQRAHIPVYGQDSMIACLAGAAPALWTLGYPDHALALIKKAQAFAEETGLPYMLAAAHMAIAYLHLHRGEAHATQEQLEAQMAITTEYGFAGLACIGALFKGWAFTQQGQIEEGRRLIHEGATLIQPTGSTTVKSFLSCILASTHKKAGQVEEGLAVVTEALQFVHDYKDHAYEAELHRLKGELLLKDERGMMNDEWKTRQAEDLSQAEEAEACFHTAIEIAREQEAKSWELRAATSLARLWQRRGKTVEAHDLLAPVYEWFTEGFDTTDLKEAKTLLAELL